MDFLFLFFQRLFFFSDFFQGPKIPMCEMAIEAMRREGESAKSEERENKARQEGATEGRREGRIDAKGGVNGDGTKTDGGGGGWRGRWKKKRREKKNEPVASRIWEISGAGWRERAEEALEGTGGALKPEVERPRTPGGALAGTAQEGQGAVTGPDSPPTAPDRPLDSWSQRAVATEGRPGQRGAAWRPMTAPGSPLATFWSALWGTKEALWRAANQGGGGSAARSCTDGPGRGYGQSQCTACTEYPSSSTNEAVPVLHTSITTCRVLYM